MRIVIMTTGTNNVPSVVDPLADQGNELFKIFYDAMTHAEHDAQLFDLVDRHSPDWVLHIGAIPEHYDKPVPTSKHFAQIGAKYKLVHLCFDGAEPVWWPHLRDYYDNGRFALQVNIDGVMTGPIGDRGLTALCPVSIEPSPAWDARPILCGFSGRMDNDRWSVLEPLIQQGLLVYRPRDSEGGHAHFKNFLSMCRIGINVATTGGHSGKHVKARTLELAAMGCLVLETAGSPLANWFIEGTDFLSYATVAEAADKIRWAASHADEAAAIASSMRDKVKRDHSHAVFWSQVTERLGYGRALRPIKQVPYAFYEIPTAERPFVHTSSPILLGSQNRYNFVAFQDRIWIVPQGLGSVDLANPIHRSHQAIRSAFSLEEARAQAV